MTASVNAAALIVIDVQSGLFQRPAPVYQADTLLENINTLVSRAHAADVPVFYIQHDNKSSLVKHSEGWQLHPQLQPLRRDFVVHKQHGNAFEQTPLHTMLESKGIQSLVITGMVTSGCVKATCIGAHRLGYRVILVEDGHSNFNKNAADAIKKWNKKLSGDGVVELQATQDFVF